MVTIFTRSITDDLASLVKQVDAAVGKNEDQKMAAFVVVLSDEPDADDEKLKEVAAKHEIKHTPLTVFDGPAGPPSYKIAKEADVTVLLWRSQTVKANHALAAGKLDKKAIEAILKDTDKILE